MDHDFSLIYKAARRTRNTMLGGMLFILLAGGGLLAGGILSPEGKGTKIGLIIFGALLTALSVFGLIKVVIPLLKPEKSPVIDLLQNRAETVVRIYIQNIRSGAYGVSRTIYQVHLLDQGRKDYILGVKKKDLDTLMTQLQSLCPQAELGYKPGENADL